MAVTDEFKQDVLEVLDEVGYAVENETDIVDDLTEIDEQVLLPGVRRDVSGQLLGYMVMKLSAVKSYLDGCFDTISAQWTAWFGADDDHGVRGDWKTLRADAVEQTGYAKNQGDYAKEQGDYAKTEGDTAQQKAGLADGIYNTVKNWFYGTVEPAVTGFKDTAEGWLQASQAAWNSWFGASESAGVRKTWSDWYTATTTAWNNWFSDTLATGVRKVWSDFISSANTWLSSAQSAWNDWFGASANAGIRKTWSDWYSATQSAWNSFFGSTASAAGGVRKIWNDWFGATQSDYAELKSDAQTATLAANNAATLANEKAVLANAKAALADEKASLANTNALYAEEQGDYAKEFGDHPPYIGNGTTGDLNYWYIWNHANQQYAKSVYATGDDLDWSSMTAQQKQDLIDRVAAEMPEPSGFGISYDDTSGKDVLSAIGAAELTYDSNTGKDSFII